MPDLKLIEYNGQKILQFTVYGKNRDQEIPQYQAKVFEKFGFSINQIAYPFELGFSHGQSLDEIVNATIHAWDYVFVWDDDSIPLRPDYFQIAYDKVKDGNTLFGCLEQSNHIRKFDGQFNHPYVGTSPFCISKKLYDRLGRPSLDHKHNVGDRCEYLTFLAEEKGACIAGLWPSHVVGLNEQEMAAIPSPTSKSPLGQGREFGFGTTYGENYSFHTMCASAGPRHKALFVDKCNQVLNA